MTFLVSVSDGLTVTSVVLSESTTPVVVLNTETLALPGRSPLLVTERVTGTDSFVTASL
jgi:hypothetical protein